MSFVLTVNSTVQCPTGGRVTPAGRSPLTVRGAAVTTPADISNKPVSGCTITNSSSTKQCTTVTSASGAATKLTVGGTGVALDTLTGSTDGSTPAVTATAGQSVLKAV